MASTVPFFSVAPVTRTLVCALRRDHAEGIMRRCTCSPSSASGPRNSRTSNHRFSSAWTPPPAGTGTPISGDVDEAAHTERVTVSLPGMTADYSVEVTNSTSRKSSTREETRTATSSKKQPKRLGSSELLQLLQSMQEEGFEDTRLSMMRSAIKNRQLEVNQLIELMKEFSFEDNRIEAAKFCYPRLVDKDDFYRVYAVLEFDMSKEELQEWVNEQ
jgi:anti-sigma28 factor (negative regulator of flagellin synthesis)